MGGNVNRFTADGENCDKEEVISRNGKTDDLLHDLFR